MLIIKDNQCDQSDHSKGKVLAIRTSLIQAGKKFASDKHYWLICPDMSVTIKKNIINIDTWNPWQVLVQQ